MSEIDVPPFPSIDDEDDDADNYVEYLNAKSDHYSNYPPAAPEGFELYVCWSEPKHWPTYGIKDDDFFDGGPCGSCLYAEVQEQLRAEEAKLHWLKHPIRGKHAARVVRWMYSMGIIAGSSSAWNSNCRWCIRVSWRGRRPYILGRQRER